MDGATRSVDGRARLTRRRKLWFTILVLGFGIPLLLVGAEFLCRALIPIERYYELTEDPILFYRLAGGIDCLDAGRRRTQTAQHIRARTIFPHDPPAGTRRVAWVGDSACFGCGVGDDQTASWMLEALAAQAGVAVESINFGVPGYNVRQVREVVKQRCPESRSLSAIVYYHHVNDIVNAPWATLAPFVPSDLYWKYERPGRPIVRWLKRSALVRRLGHTRVAAALVRSARSPDERTAPTDAHDEAAVGSFFAQCVSLYTHENRYSAQFRDDLYGMADEARRQGAELIMVYFPIRSLLHHSMSGRLADVLARWCATNGISFIDVTDEFRAAGGPALYADTTHPGPVGQRIVAERVWRLLSAGGERSSR